MVLFITLNKVVLTFESVDEIVRCDHSNPAMGVDYYAVCTWWFYVSTLCMKS